MGKEAINIYIYSLSNPIAHIVHNTTQLYMNFEPEPSWPIPPRATCIKNKCPKQAFVLSTAACFGTLEQCH